MNTELNEPKEIVRRFFFASFVLSAVSAFWLFISVVVDWSLFRFSMLLLTSATAGALYMIGIRFFRFATIRETFVMRNAPQLLSPRLREAYHETEKLIEQMTRADLKPMERQTMRNRLAEIVRSEPKIFDLLKQEILAVHPSIRLPS